MVLAQVAEGRAECYVGLPVGVTAAAQVGGAAFAPGEKAWPMQGGAGADQRTK